MSNEARVPAYRRHKQSGQAIVTLPDGFGGRHDVLLGKYGTAKSRAEYARVISEWEANDRRLPEPSPTGPDLTVNELILAYWKHAETHYRRPDGTPTAEIYCLRAALRPLRQLYGHTSVKDFGPLALKAVRQKMIESVDERTGRPWCRRSINLHTYRIRSLFRWGVEQELVPPLVLHGLQGVRGLQKGRSGARETEKVKPVPEAYVQAVLPVVSAPVRAMIELQLLAGMRPGEVVIMRGIDLDMTGPIWLYRPGSDRASGVHKTAWRDHERVIAIGPRAREIIRASLKTDLRAYLFSPTDSMEAFYEQWRKPDRRPVNALKGRTRRRPGVRYTVGSYRYAVARACAKARVPHWYPHQLRHTKATEIRREAGLDAARVVLGHRSPQITETYAELDVSKAQEVMARLG
jgi:integrase